MNTHQQLRLEATYKVSLLQKSLLPGQLPPLSTSQSNVEHFSLQLTGALDHSALKAAGSLLLEHHTVLRTAFVDIGTDEPQQRVYQDVELPWREEDWRDLLVNEGRGRAVNVENPQYQALNDWMAADRQQGFNLDQAPLLRLTLIRLSDEDYQLIGSYHPAILDRESIQYLCQELMYAYVAITAQQSVSLPAAQPFQAYIDGLTESTSAEQYWREYLKDFSAPTPLAIDHRPKVKSSADKEGSETELEERTSNLQTQRLNFTKKFTSALTTLARDYDLTLNSILQGAWAILLSRYSRETEVVWGHRVSGRSMDSAKGIEVGPINHTVPFKNTVDPDAKALSWLQALQKQQQEQQSYQNAPLSVIQSWSGIDSEIALFHSVIAFNRHPVDTHFSQQLAEANIAITPVAFYPSNLYSLSLVIDLADNITLKVDYHAALFETAAIKRLLGHYQTLLTGIVNNPIEKLGQLPLLTQQEKQQLLVDWNQTQVDYSKDRCIHQLFEEQAQKTPSAIAVAFKGQQLTYEALNQCSNQLAHYLIEQGVKPESRVGLCIERSLEMIIGIIGIVKAGGTYVPIDPEYPQQRIEYLFGNSKITLLLTQEDLLTTVPDVKDLICCCLDRDWSLIAALDIENPRISINPTNLAYIIYTSGSTGQPKGVMCTHKGLVNRLDWMQNTYQLTTRDCVLQKTPYSFDVSVWEFFWPLIVGAQLSIARPGGHKDTNYLKEVITEKTITTIHFVPSMLSVFIVEQSTTKFPNLKRVICSGEALPFPLQEIFFSLWDNVELHNLYGPTEASIDVSAWRCSSKSSHKSVSIGTPISNTQIYILDNYLQPVPVGIIGELYIGGDGLARGYWGRPEKTAERFLPDCFSGEKGERLYKTGDLVRHFYDGNIEYIGRADFQVKIRGFRIELGEIESVINQQSVIREVVVLARSFREGGDQHLVAYIVPQDLEVIDQDFLRKAIQQKLPDHMIPNFYFFLEELPLTPNGKVNRNALPGLDKSALRLKDYVAPRTETEKELTRIWAKVFELTAKEISVNSRFLELGGNSLLATRIHSQVKKIYNKKIHLAEVFNADTISRYSDILDNAPVEMDDDSDYDSKTLVVEEEKYFPLSSAQKRLWFIHQLEGGKDTRYNEPLALYLEGRLNTAALLASIAYILRRHTSLRTSFQATNGELLQVVEDALDFHIPIVKISEENLPLHIQEYICSVFDLSKTPLIKVCLFLLVRKAHVLLINMHHIICDGMSLEVLGRELSKLYIYYTNTADFNSQVPLPQMPVQYTDFSLWQTRFLHGDKLAHQMEYWKAQLAEAPSLLELPSDRPRPAAPTYHGSLYLFKIPLSIIEKIENLARDQGVTLFMALLACFNILLARNSGQNDICIGTPIANRSKQEFEGLIGFFVNTLVMRTPLKESASFEEFLQDTKNNALAAYENQDVPFEDLVDILKPDRSLSYSPIFQVMFALQDDPKSSFAFSDVHVSNLNVNTRQAKFDLTMIVTEVDDGLACSVEYSTDLYDQESILRLCDQFSYLLSSIVENPNRNIYELPLLSKQKIQSIVYEWNKTNKVYPENICIHQYFEKQAELQPLSKSVSCDEETIDYDKLNRESNKLAHFLRNQGVSPEAKVGICIERSLEMMIGLLGVLKAGGAYVPIDPTYPVERIAYLVADSGISILLTQQHLVERVSGEENLLIFCLDQDWKKIENLPVTNPEVAINALNIAYVIYTSGSTGRPKGVPVSHQSLSLLCHWHRRRFSVDEQSKATQVAGISFDAMAWEIWPYLTRGASISVIPSDITLMPKSLIAWLESHAITHCFLPTPVAEQLIDEHWPKEIPLRYLLTGGDKLKKFPPANMPFSLINNYGPTENTVVSTSGTVTRAKLPAPSIGTPIDNVQTYILNSWLNPVPVRVTGELYVGGSGLARGYQSRPDLTAECFLPDPFSDKPGARLYKTGDLARYSLDGSIEFLGRLDHQIKLRGFRIELGEVEHALIQHKGIKEAIAIVRRHESQQNIQYLVAYLVADKSTKVDQTALKTHLQQLLPDYMIPSFFIFLNELPLTPNGKVDQNALPVPDETTLTFDKYIEPRTEVEKALAAVWADILNVAVEKIGINANFFDMGGHSLLANRVVTQVREIFNVDLQIRSLFTSTTIKSLAIVVEDLIKNISEPEKEPPVLPLASREDIPLSFAQQRLWFISELEGGQGIQYNIPLAISIVGKVDFPSLEKSIDSLIKRHEVLRTTIRMIGNQAAQFVEGKANLRLDVIDIFEGDLQMHVDIHARHPFDLAHGPLLKACVLCLSPEKSILLINIHHIAADGWSMGVLTREISSFYTAYAQGHEPALPALSIQYGDFSQWQREWLKGDMLARQLDYWRAQLAEAPELLELPTDRPRPAIQSYCGASYHFVIPAEIGKKLYELTRQTGTTPFMVLLAGFKILLARYSGQRDICVGSPIANRQKLEVEKLIGFFVNTLVFRSHIDNNLTVKELLQKVKNTALSAYSNQDTPFENLVESLKPERSLSYSPLFQALFALQNVAQSNFDFLGLTATMLNSDTGTSKFDLSLFITERGADLEGVFEYNTDIFDKETIADLADHYATLLENIVLNPDQKVGSIPLLRQSQANEILIGWNNAKRELPPFCTVDRIFRAQASETPQAIAVTFEDQRLTYEELDRYSDCLAVYLRNIGIRTDRRVGISLESSLNLMIGILGILKAGAAYVPLDPQYPKHRLTNMLDQANISVLLTQKTLVERLPTAVQKVVLDDMDSWYSVDGRMGSVSRVYSQPNSLAYIIFTSGSTGLPKAVAMPHVALTNLIFWQLRDTSSRGPSKTLQFSAISFDVSFQEMFSTWRNGDTLVLVENEKRRDPFYLWQLIYRERITRLFMPYIGLQQLAEVYREISQSLGSISPLTGKASHSSLREVITAGEQLQITPPIRSMFEELEDCSLYNQYGPSETHVCTALELDDHPATWDALPSIGKPIENDKVYILDADLQPTPIGVYGNLYVGGVGLARGYLSRGDLTADRFIPNPFIREDNEAYTDGRIYDTGDIARFKRDGTIEYKGRSDSQIKVRGFRVEPGEIEKVLNGQEAVKTSIVATSNRGEDPQDKVLIAYVEPEGDADSGYSTASLEESLRRLLQSVLPEYMMPSHFVFLDKVPVTPSGKVDRRALPEPDLVSLSEKIHVPPKTKVQNELVSIWSDVLKRPLHQISIKNNFFDMGGHSLLTTRVASKIRKTFGIEIQIRDLFAATTVEALSELISERSAKSSPKDRLDYPVIQRIGQRDEVPLSYAQKRLWFISKFEGEKSTQSNIPWALRLRGILDVVALNKAFDTLVMRHDSLRTRIQQVDDQPVQLIAKSLIATLSIMEVNEKDIQVHLKSNVNFAFDLNRGPLFLFSLLRLSPEDYILIFNMHHIISDGWSIEVLNRELSQCYAAYVEGAKPQLPPLEVQYTDFSEWQQKWLQGKTLEKQIEYWKSQLGNAPSLLELPSDRPRPAVQRYQGRVLNFDFSLGLTKSLHRLSRDRDVTLFMTLVSGFSALLSRYSGQRDICVGTPVANRQRSELEDLIGFFVNTLVLRTRLDASTTTIDLLEKTRETALSAYSNQDIPFELLVDVLKPERSLSYTPIFQVMFVLQNQVQKELELTGIDVSPMSSEYNIAKFDLSISLSETRNGLAGVVEYNTDLFDEDTIARFVSSYRILLQGMVSRPEESISKLPLLSKDEQKQIIFDWNLSEKQHPQRPFIQYLFEKEVEKQPESVAIVQDDSIISYRELNKFSNAFARHLIERGVGPDVRVGVCVERSVGMIASILAILKAGGCYIPIDPEYPVQRVRYILEDAKAKLLVSTENITTDLLLPESIEVLELSDSSHKSLLQKYDYTNISVDEIGLVPTNLAYMIYTSGSTGKPKGTLVSHSGIGNLAAVQEDLFSPSQESVVLQFASIGFDAATWEWIMALSHGARLCLVSAETARSGEDLSLYIERYRVSHATLPPALLPHLSISHLSGLTNLVVAGDVCPDWLAKTWSKGRRFFNGYGPTETTVCASIYRYAHQGCSGSIGKPLSGLQIYILDSHFNPVPVGVAGEIFIGGLALARGYFGKPELTAEKFVPNPFVAEEGDRLYHSGDLARYRSDGNIEFIGRIDYQVKIRGFRVELGEIESILVAEDYIKDAVVLAHSRADDQSADYLVAYIVSDDNARFDEAALKSLLRQQLPDYMVPHFFIVLREFPLTPNGKVDRTALPSPSEQVQFTGDYIAPRDKREEALVAIWSDLLKVPVSKIGVRDNFFELGGDSILSIQVASRASKLGMAITTRQLFEFQTVEELARNAQESHVDIDQSFSEGKTSLLPIQHYFFSYDETHRSHFHQSFILHIPKEFNLEFLTDFILEFYRKHDVLRLRFLKPDYKEEWEAEFVPFSADWIRKSVSIKDINGLSPEDRNNVILESGSSMKSSFSIEEGLLLKALYLKAGEYQNSRLLVVVHHLVVDGVSWRIFFEDISSAFEQWRKGERIALSPKTTAFQNWSENLIEYSRSQILQSEKPYWQSMLLPVPSIPVDEDNVTSDNFSDADQVTICLDRTDTQVLLNSCNKAYHTQINDLLVSALLLAFYRWRGVEALAINMEGHGREALFDKIDLSRTVGWFTSAYPLRLSVSKELLAETRAADQVMADMIKTVKEQCHATPNRGIGYGILRFLAQDESLISAEAALGSRIIFNYLGQFDQQLSEDLNFSRANQLTGPDISPARRRMSLLGFNGYVIDGHLEFSLDYNRRQYHKESILSLAKAYKLALRDIISHCQKPDVGGYTPSDFPLSTVSQVDLDNWLRKYPDLADIYPATGMQVGLLFHSLHDKDEAYVSQIEWRLLGKLNSTAWKEAWRQITLRHAVFRSAFAGFDGVSPQQVVLKSVDLPWCDIDYRNLDGVESSAAFNKYRKEDKCRGFSIDEAPLMRWALFRESDDQFRFLWTHHHSLLDGWCLPIVLDELMTLYHRLQQGVAAELPAATDYRSYIEWLNQRSESEAIAFWTNQLSGISLPTDLQVDKLPVDASVSGTQIYQHPFAEALTKNLNMQARRYRVTLNVLLQAAWAYLIRHYSGESTVVFGEVVSGRSAQLKNSENIVGLCINTLPACIVVDDQASVETWLQQLQILQSQRSDYSYLPLSKIQDCHKDNHTLFDSLIVLENYPVGEILSSDVFSANGSNVSGPIQLAGFVGHEETHYDLSLSFSPGNALHLKVTYNADKYAEVTIERIVEHLTAILESLAAGSSKLVGELPWMTSSEKQEMLHDWNLTETEYPGSTTVDQLFSQQAKISPDAVAVIYRDLQISYGVLDLKSEQLASYLTQRDVGPEVRVGLCMDRSPDMVIGLLGILKAGGAYVPIDPDYPMQRIEFMVRDSSISLVLTHSHIVKQWEKLSAVDHICLDGNPPFLKETKHRFSPVAATNSFNAAYVIYTSGSTGKPKGVVVPHRAINRLVINNSYVSFGDHLHILHIASIAFDAATFEVWGALLNGSKCILYPDRIPMAGELANLICEERIDTLFLTTALFNAIVDEIPSAFDGVGKLLVGGEALSSEHVNRAYEHSEAVVIVNCYGPTENTTFSTYFDIPAENRARKIPIGRPIKNTSAYILDGKMSPVAVGVVGELYLGKDGLAREYLNRADLTAEKFVPDAYSDIPGERLYRTGDLVRYLPNGDIDFVGRTDHQIKIRGFRIETGEIESALVGCAGVKDAAVLAYSRDGNANSHFLAAYVVLDAEQDEGTKQSALRADLQAQLPDYMIPGYFIFLDKLPLTSNGKVDRKSLSKPKEELLTKEKYVEPVTEVEKALVSIWAELLHLPVKSVGIEDNFFELGGDSILSIQVASRAHKAGIGISTRQLFEYPTVEQLARLVESTKNIVDQSACVGDQHLLPIQHWFLEDDSAAKERFHQSYLLHVPEDFSLDFLQRFAEALYEKHDVLRLRFATKKGTNSWRSNYVSLTTELVDKTVEEKFLEGDTEQCRIGLLAFADAVKTGFDISKGPLIKAVYFKAEQQCDDRLLLVIHHLVVDGVSWRILFEDLFAAFDAWQRSKPIVLPAKTTSYQLWAEKLVSYSQTEKLALEKDYWLSMLKSTPPIAIDNSHVPDNTAADTAVKAISLSIDSTRALLNAAHKAYHTQINDLLLSALLLAFFRWRDMRTITVKMEGHGREESLLEGVDLTRTLGWFTTAYPLTITLPNKTNAKISIGELIKGVKEQCRSVPNKGIGYGVLRHLTKDDAIIKAEQTYFVSDTTIVFNYLGQFDQQLGQQQKFRQAQEPTGSDVSLTNTRSHLLGFNGWVADGRLRFSLDYNIHQFDHDVMNQLGNLFSNALLEIVSHCGQPGVGSYTPSDFPLVELSQGALDHWQTAYPGLEDIYPATGTQAGLLYHNLLEGDQAYVTQTTCYLEGDTDIDLLRQAWKIIVARHAIFRTAFAGWNDEALLQIVVGDIEVPWYYEDYRNLSAEKRDGLFKKYSRSDREKGFKADQSPLMRFAIFRVEDSRYRFLWSYHHCLLDGWCLPIVLDEVAICYHQLSIGVATTLTRPPAYRDYIKWLQHQDKKAAQAFWTQQLAGITSATSLEISRLAADHEVAEFRVYKHSFSQELTEHLQQLARHYKVTVNTLMQGAWAYLLHRYSGDERVIFGETVSGRPSDLPQADEMVGLFINTQPVCVNVDTGVDIGSWLQELHHQQAQRASFSYLPLAGIQLCSDIAPGQLLFNALLVFENYPVGDALSEPGSEGDAGYSPSQLRFTDFGGHDTTNYKLSIAVVPGNRLQLNAVYDTGAYAEGAIVRMVDHIGQILQGMTDTRIEKVGGLPLLTEKEQRQLLADWNETRFDYPGDTYVHKLLEQEVEKAADAIAVNFEGDQITYRELNAKSNQLAHYLIEKGLTPGAKVGLCLERSLEMIVGIVGILKAGGAYVPIDPELPNQRIEYIVRDSGIKLALTLQRHNAILVDTLNVETAHIDSNQNVFDSYYRGNPTVQLAYHSPVYAIYTSGSTGRPKGVLVSHTAYSNHMQWMRRKFAVTSADKIVHKTPLGFDAAGWEWSLPLVQGAQLLVAKPDGHRDPEYLLNLISTHRATIFQAVPSLVNMLLEHQNYKQLQSLRYLFCGGESLPAALCCEVVEKGLNAALCNLYGPTEATIDSTYWIQDTNRSTSTVPIGRPIDNVQIYILDKWLNPVPVGVMGELYIGGTGLAIGYINQEKLTAEKFIANPYSQGSDNRLYRSGDLARYLPNGDIEFVGRLDYQVKVRGFRIELGEIENALLEEEEIKEAAVLADEDDIRGVSLCAYIVAHVDGSIDQGALKTSLRSTLPEYMMPSSFVFLEKMPLNPNGKIDRKALPRPDMTSAASQKYIAPGSEVEKELATIWARVLKMPADKLSVNDDFFALGGHSLLAARLVGQVKDAFDKNIPLRAVFDQSSLSDMASLIEGDEAAQQGNSWLCLEKEAVLDAEICAGTARFSAKEIPESILLTGATGFLGRFILHELLTQTSADIKCLVRGDDAKLAHDRLVSIMSHNRLWKPEYGDRISTLPGDISRPGLGLRDEEFARLAESVDTIYHNATAMNHIASYQNLKAANVIGMKEILRLACTDLLKTVHYSSTISVFSPLGRDVSAERTVDESSGIDDEKHDISQGYTGSKWVAEKLAMMAQERGIPCSIYRYGLAVGDMQQGRYDTDQWLYRLLASCIQLGCYPVDYCPPMGLMPVDSMAKALVLLSCGAAAPQGVYHLDNPNLTDINRYFEVYNDMAGDNGKLEGLPFAQWLKVVGQGADSEKEVAIYPLMHQFLSAGEDSDAFSSRSEQNQYQKINVKCDATLAHLEKLRFHFPEIDSDLLQTYWKFIVQSEAG